MSEPLIPPVDVDSRPFFEGAARGELWIPRCAASGRFVFPPRAFSPFVPAGRLEWVRVSGRGEIWSFVVPHPPLLPWYAERAPYVVLTVALDEDPRVRVVGNLVAHAGGAISGVDPTRARIGARVRACFEEIAPGTGLPRWVLDEPLSSR